MHFQGVSNHESWISLRISSFFMTMMRKSMIYVKILFTLELDYIQIKLQIR